MARRRSQNPSSTLFTGNSLSKAEDGYKRKVKSADPNGPPGGAAVPSMSLGSLIEILEALASTVRRQGNGGIPFPLFLPQWLQRDELSWRAPGMLPELIRRSIVIRTAFTLNESGTNGWLQVIFSIPRVSDDGKLSPPAQTPTTGASSTTESGASTVAATSPLRRGK